MTMPAGGPVNFGFGPPMADFMHSVQQTLVQQDDFRGIGGHGLLDHGGHGFHTQVSIGIGDGTTVNFRELLDR